MKTARSSKRRSSTKKQSSSNRYADKPLELKSASIPVNHRQAKWGIAISMAVFAMIMIWALVVAMN